MILPRTFALLALLLTSPLWMLLCALSAAFGGRGKIFFVQERRGLFGKVFKIYKMRTMPPTSFGMFLRRHGLDEWPQLLNILRGEMAFVGPRPLPLDEGERNTERESVLPGITGLYQITPNRRGLSYEEMLALDLRFIRTNSPHLRARIIFGTFAAVIKGWGK